MRAWSAPVSHLMVVRRLFNLSLWAFALATLGCQRGHAEQDSPQNASPPPAPVAVATVQSQRLSVQHSFVGEVVANSDASLSTAESGRVRKVHVVEGDVVKQGQLLLELDDRLARAELFEARANKQEASVAQQQASREAERYQKLERESVVSALEASREVDEAARLAAVNEEAEATIKVRGERVHRHRIVAPFDGTVARRLVDPGDHLSAGQPALQLVTAEHLELLVRVPESTLDALPTLSKLEVTSNGRRVEAELRGVVDALDPATRTALLRAVPKGRPPWLRAGSSVRVHFTVEESGGWVVPRDALVHGIAGVRAMRISDGKVEPVALEIMAKTSDQALVSGELSVGDRIVTRGNERLRPGQAVEIQEANEPSDAERDD
jgi:RND family efflux transporter MFP subunit